MEQFDKILPLNVAIVGCGGIAQVIHMPLLKKHPDVKLQALCDVDTSKAAIIAEKFNVPHIYDDIEEMLQRESLDVVFILTPNNLHLPMTLLALDQGLHVFLEKPAGRNRTEVERMGQRASEVNRTIMIGMQNRFQSDVQALYKLLQAKELGNIFFVKTGWLHARHKAVKQPWLFQKNISGGGVVMDLGVQLVDLVWWLLGKLDPISVKSFSFQINPELAVEDFCVACITFANNISISLEISWDFPAANDYFYLEIAGEKGTATLNPLKLQKTLHGQIVNITPEIKDTKILIFKRAYQSEINHFIDFLTGRANELESPIDDAIQVFKIVEAIYQSINTKKEVVL